jgi:hypothetical protein
LFIIKHPNYKKVLEVIENYNKVLRPGEIRKLTDAFNNCEIADGGSRGFKEACTQMEDRAQHRL